MLIGKFSHLKSLFLDSSTAFIMGDQNPQACKEEFIDLTNNAFYITTKVVLANIQHDMMYSRVFGAFVFERLGNIALKGKRQSLELLKVASSA